MEGFWDPKLSLSKFPLLQKKTGSLTRGLTGHSRLMPTLEKGLREWIRPRHAPVMVSVALK